MKRIKVTLYLSLALNVGFLLFFGNKFLKIRDKQDSAANGKFYFMGRDKLYDLMPLDSSSIVFFGHSQIENFPTEELFHDLNVKNRGISKDVVKGLLGRVEAITGSKERGQPKKIFIGIGINDMGYGTSREVFLSDYDLLLSTLKTQLPKSEIYLLGILPVKENSNPYPTFTTVIKNPEVRSWNSGIRSLAQKQGVRYLDVYNLFAKNGALNPEYDVDGIHISGLGYIVLTNYLKPYVYE